MPAAIGNFDGAIQTKWHANIDLPCITSGVPTPNVKWTFNSQPVDLQAQRSVYDNFTLHLESVTSADTGNYTCTVWNVYGSENVTTSLLVVGKYLPIVFIIFEYKRRFNDVLLIHRRNKGPEISVKFEHKRF